MEKATKKKDSAISPASAKPVDLTAHKPSSKGDGADTSTSTGGATATRNTGAATGGAVTITISGSSSTGTSTETSTETGGAGKGAAAGKGKGKGAGPSKGAGGQPDTGDKRPHVYNITVNSTGQSGHAVDGSGEAKPDEITMKDIKGWTGPQMRAEMKKPGGKDRINRALKNRKKSAKTVQPA